MTKQQRINAFVKLGQLLQNYPQDLVQVIEQAQYKNPWYTVGYVKKAIQAIAANLTNEKLQHWLSDYPDMQSEKTVGLILAGNIPLVGFHDILCVLISGFKAKIKVSSDDAGLTTCVLALLADIEPEVRARFEIVDKLKDFDLVIATGSDNTSRYFDYYFGSKPHIIRRNRNSIGVITGQETPEQLRDLGHDIFDYFGLGCRSVSKIFIPKDYAVSQLFEGIADFKTISEHFKYNNNYDYNKSIYLINGDKHYDNGFLLLKEDTRTASPLAVLYYEEYNSLSELENELNTQQQAIQCVVSAIPLSLESPVFGFGESQCPALSDYADGVNTLDFLFENQ
ncbi:acyl-CoA reductase [Sphingobacterium thalpophilum]|uniref:Acyl-CoA reductase n=1 Tax=Sphingobacterium thalpophilum TaxID=259 RepID=A0A4U9W370_9SPHI|nr:MULTISPECIES: acyl-CoA reductase [Sphingobacterium]MCW8311707.1 acyl-CoA reductase [Sphingobacterium sp. InxBP1]VTR53122.1 Acyl-CoA reductase (LuxC) [Sphingobacterium thalpophilum]